LRAADITIQLAALLPLQTDKFTDNFAIVSAVMSGPNILVETAAPHSLVVNEGVVLADVPGLIATTGLSHVLGVATAVCPGGHDLTTSIATTVTFSGANEAEWNDTFPIIQIVDRQTIRFSVDPGFTTPSTGTVSLVNGQSFLDDVNRDYAVAATPTATSFIVTHPTASDRELAPGGEARCRPRVGASVDSDSAMKAYTEKGLDELWAIVSLDDVTASKNRTLNTDAVDDLTAIDDFRQWINQPFSVLVIVPSSAEIAGRAARDLCEDLTGPIFRCLLRSKFDSGLYSGEQGRVVFLNHGVFGYGGSTYAHVFQFQQSNELLFEDTTGWSPDVAFRQIDLTITPDLAADQGDGKMTAIIDLD
jgi:hypothetical protein